MRRWCALVVAGLAAATIAARPARAVAEDARPASLLLDSAYVSGMKARIATGDAAARAALAALEARATQALAVPVTSVMDKAITPPSGDRHDYVSQAPYWWPDPSKPDGRPYVRKDGVRNPEIDAITDHDHLSRLMDAVATLGLAYACTDREEYAAHAARLLRAWFVDPATRMNPNLRFGQYVPGVNQGRGIGIIETRGLPEMLDGVLLIAGSPAWTTADDAALQAWMRSYLTWLLESPHGRDEAKNRNNHETWYAVQVAGLGLYTGQIDLARRTVEGAKARIAAQIEPDGRQPRELERTRSWHYSAFNLEAFMDLAVFGDRVGVDLWTYRTADGRGIRQALEFLVPFVDGGRKWPYDQITPFTPAPMYPILRRAAVAWKEPAYKTLAERVGSEPTLLLVVP